MMQVSNIDDRHTQMSVERSGDCEFFVKRTFNASAAAVFRAWSQPDLFRLWWLPKSMTGASLTSCLMDVRTGGRYRLEFGACDSETVAFHGNYVEVIPDRSIVWTNDEEEEGALTTVTFDDRDGQTQLTFREMYPSTDALEEALQGSATALPEQFRQLDELLASMV
ncbi:SRPBCC domain-containing protein [Rhizobium sp. 2MFCol3.1]|uniref:SRPBCC domain-containing protein n=1 Tax=Rhizobium sp. 2MFCol3.1 TaxID=1246459 RepID=UPI00036A4858|nr:SRPBCC domain-containing protein [Rhizobium sp. 2MFCol3.1]